MAGSLSILGTFELGASRDTHGADHVGSEPRDWADQSANNSNLNGYESLGLGTARRSNPIEK